MLCVGSLWTLVMEKAATGMLWYLVTPGCAWEALWDAGDQTRVNYVQSQRPPRCAMAPAIVLLTFNYYPAPPILSLWTGGAFLCSLL